MLVGFDGSEVSIHYILTHGDIIKTAHFWRVCVRTIVNQG